MPCRIRSSSLTLPSKRGLRPSPAALRYNHLLFINCQKNKLAAYIHSHVRVHSHFLFPIRWRVLRSTAIPLRTSQAPVGAARCPGKIPTDTPMHPTEPVRLYMYTYIYYDDSIPHSSLPKMTARTRR